jgi:hypothetical protein
MMAKIMLGRMGIFWITSLYDRCAVPRGNSVMFDAKLRFSMTRAARFAVD